LFKVKVVLSPSHCGAWVVFFYDCLSGFPAFAENDEKRNGNDGMGAFPAPSSPNKPLSPSPTHIVTSFEEKAQSAGPCFTFLAQKSPSGMLFNIQKQQAVKQ